MVINDRSFMPLNVSSERVRQMAVYEKKISYARNGNKGSIWVCDKDVEALINVFSAKCDEHESEYND